MNLEGKRGTGRFRWNRGGWFGGQIGATLWLVLLGCLLMAQGRVAGAAVLVLGLLPNLVGLLLWRRRHRLSPYPAVQLLLATAGISALVSMLVLLHSGVPLSSLQLPSGLWFLGIYPGLMFVFHLQERAGRKTAA
jgi:hypothetical protein